MIPSAFEYERATSLDDALSRLAAANGAGRLLAGGHSLVPLMKLRLTEPTVLIDIARIAELAGVREQDGTIEVGALTVHHDVATSALLQARCPAVADTGAAIGDPQVRNRGTIGGSVAHADPAADYPAVMMALGANFHVKGPGGWRVVPAGDFSKDVFTVDVASDEILAKVTFAPAPASAYAKLYQRASRFAIVGVAAALDVTDGIIASARVGLTGAGATPSRLANVEEALVGQSVTDAIVAAAAACAGDGLEDLNTDIHASAEYRRAMIPVFTKRAIQGAVARIAPAG